MNCRSTSKGRGAEAGTSTGDDANVSRNVVITFLSHSPIRNVRECEIVIFAAFPLSHPCLRLPPSPARLSPLHRHCHLPESRPGPGLNLLIAPLHPLWGPADPLHVPVGLQDDGLGEGKRLAVRGISGSGGVQGACAAAGLFRGMASRCPGTVVAIAVAMGVATIVATRLGVGIACRSGGVFGTGGF